MVGAGLFLGGLTAFPYLQELGITHVLVSTLFRRRTACAHLHYHLRELIVLTLLQSILNMYITDLLEQQGSFKRLEIWLPDHPAADILRHLPPAVAFVRDALSSGGRVLVHCAAGVSRSATVQPPQGCWNHFLQNISLDVPAKVCLSATECQAGPCMSCTSFHWLPLAKCMQVVTAYLMKAESLSAEAAREALARVHPQAWPNEGFCDALRMCAALRQSLRFHCLSSDIVACRRACHGIECVH